MNAIIKYLANFIFGAKFMFHVIYFFRQTFFKNYIVSITYHDTPSNDLSKLEEHLKFLSKYYENCNLSSLDDFFSGKKAFKDKPGLIITFDDGLYSNYLFAADLLEKYGFTGYFMIPVGFCEVDILEQEMFANVALINYSKDRTHKLAMNWSDISDLRSRGHIIGCHGYSHCRLSKELTDNQISKEIFESKNLLQERLNENIQVFTWIGGEEWAYGRASFNAIKMAGYKYVFCTNCKPIFQNSDHYFLERYHVDSFYNLMQLRMVFSGIFDIAYFFKRRRIYNYLNN
jgi:peptidoglycan/xylan/chitin deacetylase (PgdA/CDA1 family)